MKDYDLTLSANEQREIHAAGAFIRVRAATGAVRVDSDTGARLELDQGDKVRIREGFRVLRVTDLTGAANTITLTVGDGDADSTLLAGSVVVSSVTTPPFVRSYNRTENETDTYLGGSSVAGVAAQYSHLELWNPAASGINAYVTRAACSVYAAGTVSLGGHNAALGSAVVVAADKATLTTGSGGCEIRRYTGGAIVGTYFNALYLAANSPAELISISSREPLKVAPGVGLVLTVTSVNVALSGLFEWWEESF